MKIKFGNTKLRDYLQNKWLIPYTMNVGKAIEKYFNIHKTNGESAEGIPDILPANGHDRCNYFARYRMANFQIQTIMKLDGMLDYNRLVKAVRLSVDAEPVFGCRFVEGEPPYWKRLDNLDKIEFCSFEETRDLDQAIRNFVESPLSMHNDPLVKVRLIRCGAHDALCIKVNHACCDGAGAKEYNLLLSEIYSALSRENGLFIPRPKIGGRTDQDRLFYKLGIKDPIVGWNPRKDAPKTVWAFPWKLGRSKAISYITSVLPLGQLDTLSKYGKQRGATINDLILTAYYRAMFELYRPPYGIPMDIGSTIDLRRYLDDGKAVAIRNFSGGFTTAIPRIKGESFEETLSRVMRETGKVKDGQPGLQNAMGGEFVERSSFTQFNIYYRYLSNVTRFKEKYLRLHEHYCSPGLSNVGFVSKPLIRFGENTVTYATLIPPAVHAPGFLLLSGSYNGLLTLAASFYESEISFKNIEKLLNKIRDELMYL